MKQTEDESTQRSIPDSSQESADNALSNESRRAFFKATGATILAAPAILISPKSVAAEVETLLPPSPPTTPWKEELPEVIETLQQTDLLIDPLSVPMGEANTGKGECGRASHGRWDEFFDYSPSLPP
ncbi:MAG: bilirubin oxidase, partial [Nitrosomonas sp.]|nr:bilirubin oxidase [Nitrosomonas sp.]